MVFGSGSFGDGASNKYCPMEFGWGNGDGRPIAGAGVPPLCLGHSSASWADAPS